MLILLFLCLGVFLLGKSNCIEHMRGHCSEAQKCHNKTENLTFLEGMCIDFVVLSSRIQTDASPVRWSYTWCYKTKVQRVRLGKVSETKDSLLVEFIYREEVGSYFSDGKSNEEIYKNDDGQVTRKVEIKCCNPSDVDSMDGQQSTRHFSVLYPATESIGRQHSISLNLNSKSSDKIAYMTESDSTLGSQLSVCVPALCNSNQFNSLYSITHHQYSKSLLPKKPLTKEERMTKRNSRRKGFRRHGNGLAAATAVDVVGQRQLLDRVKHMFTHAYDSYMIHAFPEAELRPLSCVGGPFELVKIPMVTLIDTLDTLMIMGNRTEFARAVHTVVSSTPDFNLDVNVSLFETTIRVLGGLLSAHLLALDSSLRPSRSGEEVQFQPYGADQPPPLPTSHFWERWKYDGKSLLTLAVDLGRRLLPAFDTKTKIPFGTVNLMFGVPEGETKIASTAGAGSLLMEFEVLSQLSGDESFGQAALTAMKALYRRRSAVGLIGKHINTETGAWHESISGIGSNSDSYYEYMLKSHWLFRRQELYRMFSDSYFAIKKFVLLEDRWFTEVDMFTGKLQRRRVENLAAFWPGMEATLGFVQESAEQLNALYSVWNDVGFLPEEFDYMQWQQGGEMSNSFYPLRPELIESTYHQYRATGDRTWLTAGKQFLESIESMSRTACGYASLATTSKESQLQDQMPSFFLSETVKYLYLLFDETNFIHSRPYIFSTEAHPFETSQLHSLSHQQSQNSTAKNESNLEVAVAARRLKPIGGGTTSSTRRRRVKGSKATSLTARRGLGSSLATSSGSLVAEKWLQVVDLQKEHQRQDEVRRQRQARLQEQQLQQKRDSDGLGPKSSLLPMKCLKRRLWGEPAAYKPDFIVPSGRNPAGAPKRSTTTVNKRHFVLQLLSHIYRKAIPKDKHRRGDYFVRGIRSDVCKAADQPAKKASASLAAVKASSSSRPAGTQHPQETSPPEAGLLRTVEVNMGPLGDFEVKVFPDGFAVLSRQDKSLVEISNVGKSVVLVRDSLGPLSPLRSKAVVATISGLVKTCTVQVISEDRDVLLERSCSLANFGSTTSSRVQGPLSMPLYDHEYLCRAPQGSEAFTTAGGLEGDVDGAPREVADQQPGKRWWWQWKTSHAPTAGKGEGQGQQTVEGAVLLSRRGGCMFEEKALVAQQLGAAALVVRNTEEGVFIMAGKREVDAPRSASSPAQLTPGEVAIPAVMVGRSDGDDLAALIQSGGPTAAPSPQLRLVMDSHSIVFNSEFFGNLDYPKVWISKTVVYVLSRSNWGTFLTSSGSGDGSQSGDWQLYLMSRKDMATPQMVPLVDLATQYAPRQPRTFMSTVVTHPVEMYRYFMARRCADVFHVAPRAAQGTGLLAGSPEEYFIKSRRRKHRKNGSNFRYGK